MFLGCGCGVCFDFCLFGFLCWMLWWLLCLVGLGFGVGGCLAWWIVVLLASCLVELASWLVLLD